MERLLVGYSFAQKKKHQELDIGPNSRTHSVHAYEYLALHS